MSSTTRVDELRTAIERSQLKASFVEDVVVVEKIGDKTVWQGSVSVSILRSPKAIRAYAWSSPIEGSTKRRYYAVSYFAGRFTGESG